MKNITVFGGVAAIVFIFSCASFGSGKNRGETIEASKNYITKQLEAPGDIEVIDVIGPPDVEYYRSSDSTSSLSVYGSDNVVDLVEATVSGNTLRVKFRDGVNGMNSGKIRKRDRIWIDGDPKIKVVVSTPGILRTAMVTGSGDLKINGTVSGRTIELRVTGSGDIEAKKLDYDGITMSVTGSGDIGIETVKTNNIVMSVTGSGDIEIANLVADTIKASVTGSGDIELAGSSPQATYLISGSGDIEAHKVLTNSATAKISGSGGITCHAIDILTASVTGSGSIRYAGNPASVNISPEKNIKPM